MKLDPKNMVKPNQPLPTTNRTNYSHVPPLNPFSAVELRLFKPLTEEEEYQRQIKLLPRIKRWLGLSNEPIRPENLKPSTFYQNIKIVMLRFVWRNDHYREQIRQHYRSLICYLTITITIKIK